MRKALVCIVVLGVAVFGLWVYLSPWTSVFGRPEPNEVSTRLLKKTPVEVEAEFGKPTEILDQGPSARDARWLYRKGALQRATNDEFDVVVVFDKTTSPPKVSQAWAVPAEGAKWSR